MTRTDDPDLSLKLDLETLMALHGARRVLLAALSALLSPRHRPLSGQFCALDDHLRADIGLPPAAPPSRMPHWTHFGW